MALPIPVVVELWLNAAWTAITSLVYHRDQPTITRGSGGEGSPVERSVLRFTANNRSGNLSPRNPTGTWYGQLGRNTPCRLRLSSGGPPGYLLQHDDGRANTPDTANLSITGDIDIRVDITPEHWDRAQGLANKLLNPTDRSWAFYLNADSTLGFTWSADGSALLTATSTAAVSPPASGRLALRVTLDVVNGANKTVTFSTATNMDSSFSQLGSAVTTAGNTSIFNSAANLEIGGAQGVVADDLTGRLYGFQMYASLNGTLLRADVDLSDEEPGPGPFTDGSGNVWTLVADASIVRPDIRFSGELSDLPQRWEASGRDVYVPVEASGVLRRLGQGRAALKSTLYRANTSATFNPLAYWPCEDESGASEFASAVGGPPLGIIYGTPTFSSFTDFKCSAPLPLMATSEWLGKVPPYTGNGTVQIWFLLAVPTAGAVNNGVLLSAHTTGTVAKWNVRYGTGGTLTLLAFDGDDTQLMTSGAIGFDLDGKLVRVEIALDQNGANIDWAVTIIEVGSTVLFGLSGTLNSQTISRCHKIGVNPGHHHDDVAIGHISVDDEWRFLTTYADELKAFGGEVAGRRVERLCEEEGVVFRGVGDLDATTAMGPQLPNQLLDLLRECADADGGVLYEPRDFLGLAYRGRADLCNQDALLALDYTAGHLTELEPVDDDQNLRNDITVQRLEGASARAVKASGALSVLAPPNGVGIYDEQVTLNLAADSQCADMAGWRLARGTVDEARYPAITCNLIRPVFQASSALYQTVLDVEVGDRVTVDNAPAWLPPDLISQLAIGFEETIAQRTLTVRVICQPETPFGLAGVYEPIGGTDSRYSSDATTTTEALDTTETGVDVSTPSGPVWTHVDGDYDIVIGGERMTVTAVTGAGAAQTLTVTRSVNGIVKSHSTGAVVELFRPAVYVP